MWFLVLVNFGRGWRISFLCRLRIANSTGHAEECLLRLKGTRPTIQPAAVVRQSPAGHTELTMRKTNLVFLTAPVFLMFALALSVAGQAPTPQANLIHIDIAGLRNAKGKVRCAIFSSAGDFPKHADKALTQTASAITDDHATCEFSGIAPDPYAVSDFHDENGNGRLDTNFFGTPREGVDSLEQCERPLRPTNDRRRLVPLCWWAARS
jgi:uncharacterized protein (DUF2141 family)